MGSSVPGDCSDQINSILQAATADCGPQDTTPWPSTTPVQKDNLVQTYQYDIGFSFDTDMSILCSGGLEKSTQKCNTCQQNQECVNLACQIADTLQRDCALLSVWVNHGAYGRKLLQKQPSILLTFYESNDPLAQESNHDTRQLELN